MYILLMTVGSSSMVQLQGFGSCPGMSEFPWTIFPPGYSDMREICISSFLCVLFCVACFAPCLFFPDVHIINLRKPSIMESDFCRVDHPCYTPRLPHPSWVGCLLTGVPPFSRLPRRCCSSLFAFTVEEMIRRVCFTENGPSMPLSALLVGPVTRNASR